MLAGDTDTAVDNSPGAAAVAAVAGIVGVLVFAEVADNFLHYSCCLTIEANGEFVFIFFVRFHNNMYLLPNRCGASEHFKYLFFYSPPMCKTVGIVGGMGPYADLDVVTKIRKLRNANRDQEHISVVLVSFPNKIPDRSEFIKGYKKINPAEGIFLATQSAVKAGAEIIAIPCATAHSPKILDRFFELVKQHRLNFEFVHLIKSVGEYIEENYLAKKIGVLSTYGAYLGGAYDVLKDYRIDYIFPDENVIRDVLHPAIYHPEFGIKVSPTKISDFARTNVILAMKNLVDKGAEVIVLGCTELPLAFKIKSVMNVQIIDINEVLAMKILEKCK